jgi:hypothetical protein
LNRGIDTISSNTFLSLLSNAFLNDLHFRISISDAIRYEGIVRPIHRGQLFNLRSGLTR